MTTPAIDALQRSVGTEYVSDWVEVSQDMIDRFAAATGDHQFIHVDPVAAAQTPFGGTIAHGFLTLSLMPMLMAKTDMPRPAGALMGVNYGGDKVRFLTPVPSGARVRGRFVPLSVTEKRPGQYQQSTRFTLEIEGVEKPALIAEWISQLFV